jgi:hypothetical protein
MLPARGKTARFRAWQSDNASADMVDAGFPQPQFPPIERHAGTIGAVQTARRQNSLIYEIRRIAAIVGGRPDPIGTEQIGWVADEEQIDVRHDRIISRMGVQEGGDLVAVR